MALTYHVQSQKQLAIKCFIGAFEKNLQKMGGPLFLAILTHVVESGKYVFETRV